MQQTKPKVCATVAHPFLSVKRLYKFTQVCYQGMEKNAHRFFVACGRANLHRARHFLMRQERKGAPVAA